MIADLAEPGLLHQPSQLEGCHEPLDRLRQIGVRPPVTSDERAEVTRLRRELRIMTMERDFLRKAAAFFARSGK